MNTPQPGLSADSNTEEREQLFEILLANVHHLNDALNDWIMTGPRPDGLAAGDFPLPDRAWMCHRTGLTDGMVITALAAFAATGAVTVPAPGLWRFTPDSELPDVAAAQDRAVTVIDLMISCGIPALTGEQPFPQAAEGQPSERWDVA